MPSPRSLQRRRWSVILAGGDGRAGTASVRRPGHRPPQFRTLLGPRTPYLETLDRALETVGVETTLSVVGPGHRTCLPAAGAGTVLEQPCSRGTAPAVTLALAAIMAVDPEGAVLILPSDHLIHPEPVVRHHLRELLELAESRPDRIVLLAAPADAAETGYGWIVTTSTGRSRRAAGPVETPLEVSSFVEKPSQESATRLLEAGAMWSTMIIAARARSLWDLIAARRPELADRMGLAAALLRGGARSHDTLLRELHADLPPVDLSRHVLEWHPERLLAAPLLGAEWSDWERTDRVIATAHRIPSRSASTQQRRGSTTAGVGPLPVARSGVVGSSPA